MSGASIRVASHGRSKNRSGTSTNKLGLRAPARGGGGSASVRGFSISATRQRTIAADGLAERCDAVAGNFFESVPAAADAYVLKQVIHDWDDAPAVAILRNVRQAIKPEGRLLLIEIVIPPGNEPSLCKFSDLDMLVVTGGRERTEIEYRDLFANAGFTLTAIHPTASGQSVIEGVPVAEG